MINTIVFDIGRVLIEFEWWDYIYAMFDKETADTVTRAMWATHYWHELDRGVLSVDEIVELFYSAAPEYKAEIKQTFDRVGECVKRREWAIPYIESLKERGYRVLYLSNFSEYVMDSNRGALDFMEYMDGGVISCDEKVIKPDPEIYKRLIAKYDLVPAECLFIDDHDDNVEAARELGMHAIVFKNYEQMLSDVEAELRDAE